MGGKGEECMSTKKIFASALALAVFGAVAAQAQELLPAPLTAEPAAASPAQPPETTPVPAAQQPPGRLSSWITYTRADCCGPMGCNGPIGYELFLRSGASLPAEGAIFGHTLETGWDIEGGVRSLFFNPAMDRDWSIDLSISNILNRGQRSDITVPYSVFVTDATGAPVRDPSGALTRVTIPASIRELNRTFVNAGLGLDWYLAGTACVCDAPRWRVGLDAGGRLGTAKVEFFQTTHHTDTIGGVYFGLHTDLEVPHGCCTFLVGFRVEWDYTWTDILQIQNNSDLMDVNFLATFGVRY
jgi:hypothetical protein